MRPFLAAALVGATLAVLPWQPAYADGTGTVTTLLGTGVLDGGPATEALVAPYDSTTAADGTRYLADPDNGRVRVVEPDGVIYTAAEGTTFAAHRLVLADGDVIVAEPNTRRVRRIDGGTEEVTAFAGNGQPGTATPDASATSQPVTPDDVAYDAATGRVLIADTAANRVYAVGTNGKLDVVAGAGTTATLHGARSLAIAPDGALYVGGDSDVRRVADGTATVVAGGGTAAAVEGAAATGVALPVQDSLAAGPDGTLYVRSHPHQLWAVSGGLLAQVRYPVCGYTGGATLAEVDAAGRLLTACRVLWRLDGAAWTRVAGDPREVLPVPDGTFFLDVGFRPKGMGLGVVRTPAGVVFGHGHSIYRLDGEFVRRVAGNGDKAERKTPDGTPALAAPIAPCPGITALADGTVVFAEPGRVRAVRDGVLTTLAGGGATFTFTEGMAATGLALSSACVTAVAGAPDGDLYLGTHGGVYRVDVEAGTLHRPGICPGVYGDAVAAAGSTVAVADGRSVCRYDTATGRSAVTHLPTIGSVTALDVAPDGRVLIGRAGELHLLTPDDALTVVAGGGTDGGADDSTETTLADLDVVHPAGLLLDDDGGIVWQDHLARLRRVAPGWSVDPVDPVTGINGTIAYDGDNAVATLTWTPPATGHDAVEVTATDSDGYTRTRSLPSGATTVTLTGLDAGESYVFDVRPRRGQVERAPETTFRDLVPAATAPADDPGLYVYSAGAGRSAALVWTTPAGVVASEVRIAPGTTPPATAADGTRVYRGAGTGTLAHGLTPGQPYAVTVFGVDALGAATPAWTGVFTAGDAPRVVLTSGPGWTTGTATFGWTVRGGAASVRCELDSAVVECGDDGVTLTGLTETWQHRLRLRPVGPFGTGEPAEWTFGTDLTAPRPGTEVPWPATLGTAVTVTNTAADDLSGTATYDLRYRRVHYTGASSGYVSPASWLGSATREKRLTGLKPGYTYCFSSRATDLAGNTSAWTADRCVSTVLDDRALAASAGWTRGTSTAYHLGTYTRTTQYGRTLTIGRVVTGRVVLVATKCPTCGVVGVYVNGTLVSKLDLALPYTERKVLINQGWFGVRTGTVTLKSLTSGKPVAIDGVAFSRERY